MGNDIFGVSEKALQLCESRAVMLTNNIVNSSTPNYKARDIDFHKILKDVNQTGSLVATDPHHLKTGSSGINGANTMYRVPMQISMDGNTVDENIERKSFIENSLRYEVNLTFIQNKTDQLMKAMKGD